MEPQEKVEGHSDPQPEQPRMYGGPLGSGELEWSWATERLGRARNYWIATTRPNGQPHCRPVWGVWLNNVLYFSTGSLAVKNLAVQPAITVHLESGNEVVIIEGLASPVNEPFLLKRVVRLYNQKYSWNLDVEHLHGPFYAVYPLVAFGWHFEDAELSPESSALKNATRWRFMEP